MEGIMQISDRADNRVIADVHPMLAAEVLKLANGDKTRIVWITPYEAIVRNRFSFHPYI